MSIEPTQWKAVVSHRFDNIAEMWRKRGLPDADRLNPVLAALGCELGSLILDAGCGTGNWTAALVKQGYRVHGFDLSPKMIENAQVVAQELGLDPTMFSFQVGDTEQLTFANATFDAIICFNVLDFAPRPGQALLEFWRVLKPGGRLILMDLGANSPVKTNWWQRFLPDNVDSSVQVGNHIHPWEMEKLLEALGWQIIDQQPIFGPALDGSPNLYNKEFSDNLSDPILQQTIASTWRFVCVRG